MDKKDKLEAIADEICKELGIPALTANFYYKVQILACKIYNGELKTIKKKESLI